jgi:hypothetical protein
MLTDTARFALDVYGGVRMWELAASIEAEVSAYGLAFVLKGRPPLAGARISMDVHRPYSRITPIGRDPGISGVLCGSETRLEASDGTVVSSRPSARGYFPGGRRLFRWDDLDMAYFANYAFWNYFTLPALMINTAVTWAEIRPGVLEARFPPEIPTHSEIQEFHFDPDTGLLRQHNYTAEIISRLATAAHVVDSHSLSNGVMYPSQRRVTPRARGGRARRGPLLIGIEVHDFRVLFASERRVACVDSPVG